MSYLLLLRDLGHATLCLVPELWKSYIKIKEEILFWHLELTQFHKIPTVLLGMGHVTGID